VRGSEIGGGQASISGREFLRGERLHSDIFPERNCHGQLIELPDQRTEKLTATRCEVCWTELSWLIDEPNWVDLKDTVRTSLRAL
jgi:hypothetical protein